MPPTPFSPEEQDAYQKTGRLAYRYNPPTMSLDEFTKQQRAGMLTPEFEKSYLDNLGDVSPFTPGGTKAYVENYGKGLTPFTPEETAAYEKQKTGKPVSQASKGSGIISRLNNFFDTNPVTSGLQKIGGVVEGAASAVTSPFSRIASTATSTARGLGNLGAYGIAKLAGNEEASWSIMAEEAAAQRRDTAQPKQFRPAQNMQEAAGLGLQAGATLLAAPYAAWLSTLPFATPALVGLVSGGAAGLTAGGGAGLESSGTQNLGALETLDKTLGSSMIGGAAGAGTGYTIGRLSETDVDRARQKARSLIGKVTQSTGRQADRSLAAIGPQPVTEEGVIITDTADDSVKALSIFDKDDLKGIKTYSDLTDTADVRIQEIQSAKDAAFAKVFDPVPVSTFDKTVKVGGKVRASNPVLDALDDLTNLYGKTREEDALGAVAALREKALSQGLSAGEIDGIARKYGTEFGSKAFNPRTGDALTSTGAKAYENTRSAVKEAARSLMPDETTKILDAQQGNLLTLRQESIKMEQAVEKLQNRVIERGLIEKIARGLGTAFDMVTFGGPKAFVTKLFFPSNVGLKTMNSLDLQSALNKNLTTATNLMKLSDTKLVAEATKLLQATLPLITSGIAASQK